MNLLIKNTLSREKEIFKPIRKNYVTFYQCGPTVYWFQHIGNMRAVTLADFILRTLKYFNYNVNFVRNYTDVGHLKSDNDEGDDKMKIASEREHLQPKQIAKKYISKFESDIKKLNIIPPTHSPKATEYIPEQINMIETLLKKEFAYLTDLAIYFDTSKVKNYNKLSGQKIEENLCGAGFGSIQDNSKKNNTDFALWFFKAGTHKNALQFWESPFNSSLVSKGEGFPGWHLECSVMAKTLLGDTIDIKMGGIEHIPIHHTNEIAQSESANNKEYVHYWLHNEMLLFNNKKMSKSDGTTILLSDIENKGFSALDLRYFFLQAHYRSKQNFTWNSLLASKKAREKLIKKISLLPDNGKIDINFKNEFEKKISDDFSTPEALAIVWKVLKSNISNANKKATIIDFDNILGLNLNINNNLNLNSLKIPKNISILLNEREAARKNKDWKKSDLIRDKILKFGYEIIDTNNKQKIKKV